VATTSKKRARELCGTMRPPLAEIAIGAAPSETTMALADPEVVFWHPASQYGVKRQWRRA
jgi:hypothetical protein